MNEKNVKKVLTFVSTFDIIILALVAKVSKLSKKLRKKKKSVDKGKNL